MSKNAMPADKPVDLVHLSRQTLGDSALAREVLNLFEVQAGMIVDRLKRARTQAEWWEAAHTLKGSARGIGAFGVAAAAEAVEAEREALDGAAARASLAALETAVGEATRYIADIKEAA